MAETKLFELSIAEAGRKLREGAITSMALTEDALARIGAIDPALDSFITVTADRARADATAAAGDDSGSSGEREAAHRAFRAITSRAA